MSRNEEAEDLEFMEELEAAARLDVPVVMIARPPLPEGLQQAGSVADAVTWVGALNH